MSPSDFDAPVLLDALPPLAQQITFNSAALVHETLGCYHIDAYIGQGATSLVYRAHHVNAPQQRFILKVLRPHLTGQRSTLRAYRQEALLGQLVDHPSIVKTLAACYAEGLYFLIQDCLEHTTTLDALLHRQRRLAQVVAVQIGIQMTEALHYLHAEVGIAHRDVKPRNILIAQQQSQCTATLIDFGLAVLLPQEDSSQRGAFSALRHHGHDDHHVHDGRAWPLEATAGDDQLLLVGSPGFMPPEIILGAAVAATRKTTAAADIYALGVTLYVALTGAFPYQGRSLNELRNAINTSAPLAPSFLTGGISSSLNAVIMNAIDPHPNNRYPTATAFLADLRAIVLG